MGLNQSSRLKAHTAAPWLDSPNGGILIVRLTRVHLYLLGGVLLFVIGPMVFSQPDPNGRGRGGKGGQRGTRMGPDPNAFWDQLAQGKDSININEVQFPPQMAFFADRMRQGWADFLQKKGITNGIMTKELFLAQREEAKLAWQGGGKGNKGMKMRGMPQGGASGAAPGSPPADPKEEDAKLEEEARRWFTALDKNKDGVLDREEARTIPALRDFDRYDLNRDGKISVDEWVEAYKDEQGRRGRGSRAVVIQGSQAAQEKEEEKRPVVYRVGKLPKELPPWFAQYDTDKDGQVGLHEWKAAGRATIEFLSMDANGDGFLTVEEVLRFQKANKAKNGTNAQGGPGGGMRAQMGPRGTGGIPGAGIGGRGGLRPTGGTPTMRTPPGGNGGAAAGPGIGGGTAEQEDDEEE
jgi:Ca2+-binding EF-hand superfamily protein